MKIILIQGQLRADLEDLLLQLREHGPGGGSSKLTAAMEKFNVITEHDLVVQLTNMLLGIEYEFTGAGGDGGSGTEPPPLKHGITVCCRSCGARWDMRDIRNDGGVGGCGTMFVHDGSRTYITDHVDIGCGGPCQHEHVDIIGGRSRTKVRCGGFDDSEK